jgi:hypothetical protein
MNARARRAPIVVAQGTSGRQAIGMLLRKGRARRQGVADKLDDDERTNTVRPAQDGAGARLTRRPVRSCYVLAVEPGSRASGDGFCPSRQALGNQGKLGTMAPSSVAERFNTHPVFLKLQAERQGRRPPIGTKRVSLKRSSAASRGRRISSVVRSHLTLDFWARRRGGDVPSSKPKEKWVFVDSIQTIPDPPMCRIRAAQPGQYS